jgi:hypothetical protein
LIREISPPPADLSHERSPGDAPLKNEGEQRHRRDQQRGVRALTRQISLPKGAEPRSSLRALRNGCDPERDQQRELRELRHEEPMPREEVAADVHDVERVERVVDQEHAHQRVADPKGREQGQQGSVGALGEKAVQVAEPARPGVDGSPELHVEGVGKEHSVVAVASVEVRAVQHEPDAGGGAHAYRAASGFAAVSTAPDERGVQRLIRHHDRAKQAGVGAGEVSPQEREPEPAVAAGGSAGARPHR